MTLITIEDHIGCALFWKGTKETSGASA